jgi:hypothetical protein
MRRPRFVLDHHEPTGRIDAQFQERRAALVDARAALFDHLLRLRALGGTRRDESLRLALQIYVMMRL